MADHTHIEWTDQVFAVMALAPRHTFQVLTKRPGSMKRYLSDPATVARVYDLVMDMVVVDGAKAILTTPRTHDVAPLGNRVMLDLWPLPNVWLGVSVEDQRRADERIPILLDTPAAIRWISAEPLLGPIDLYSTKGGTQWIGGQRGCTGSHQHGGHPGETIHGVAHQEDPRHPHHHHDERCGSGLDWVVAGGESGPMHPDWARALRDQCASAGVPFMFKQWGEWSEACSDVREADGSHIEVAPDSDEGEALYDPATDRLIALDGRLFTPDTLPPDTPARLIERLGKRAAGRLLDGVEHNAFPQPIRTAPIQAERPSRDVPRPVRSAGEADSVRTR